MNSNPESATASENRPPDSIQSAGPPHIQPDPAGEKLGRTGFDREPAPEDLDPAISNVIQRIHPLNIMASPVIEPSIIDPICGIGDSAIIAASPGIGKTLLTADLIVAWCHPERSYQALGGLLRIDSVYANNYSIAIIDGENTPDRWQTTIRRKIEAERLDPNRFRPVVNYLRPSDVGLHKPNSWTARSQNVARALAELNVALVIIDTVGRMWSPEDLAKGDWVQRGLAPFRSACQELGITVIGLAHTRRSQGKGDSGPRGPLGSTLQEAQVDTFVLMDKAKFGRGCRLSLRKCRRAPWIIPGATVELMFTEELSYDPQPEWAELWPRDPSACSFSVRENETYGVQLARYLRTHSDTWFKSAELAEAVGCEKRTITGYLKDLGRRVVRNGRGRATKWRWAE